MSRDPSFEYFEAVDTTALPSSVPAVAEIGATSAPLKSASFFIGARCNAYNDDFMLCKRDSQTGPGDCLKEGRRVTRCAASVISDINKHCLDQFRLHWQCLEQGNQDFYNCRPAERLLNKCVFDNLKLEKRIPGVPQQEQIHLKQKPHMRPAFEDAASVQAEKKAQKA